MSPCFNVISLLTMLLYIQILNFLTNCVEALCVLLLSIRTGIGWACLVRLQPNKVATGATMHSKFPTIPVVLVGTTG